MSGEKYSFFEKSSFELDKPFTDKAVLTFIEENQKILLIHKKRGLGKGKINGPGGKLEKGESYIQAAIRETEEEVGLLTTELELRACLGFYFLDGYSLYVQVFFTNRFSGTITETEEAVPFWCDIQAIPYEKMWADDILWLPSTLKGDYVEGLFHFDADTMLNAQVSAFPKLRAT